MGMSNRERQANFQKRRRQAAAALADALAEIEVLRARVEVLQRERDRFEGLVGYALKQEEWAKAEAERSAKGVEPHTRSAWLAAPKIIVRPPAAS